MIVRLGLRRRARETAPERLDDATLATTWQVVSLLLEYPSDELVERVPVLRAAVEGLPAGIAEALGGFLDRLASAADDEAALTALRADYVDTFDVTRKCALHLSYFTDGDTRKRGVSLVRFKQAYRKAGVEFDADELPDYLPVVLEFGAAHDIDGAWELLTGHRVGIELLAAALARRESPWLPVVTALRHTLPELDGTDEEALARLIAQGPPKEDVGLENDPYGAFADPALSATLNPRPESGGLTELGATIPVRSASTTAPNPHDKPAAPRHEPAGVRR